MSSSHLERTLQVFDRPQHPACGARIQRFSTQISHRRCSAGALAPAVQFQSAAGLSSWLSALADTLYWRGFLFFPGLNDADVQKPPKWASCAPPLGSGHTRCFLKRLPVQKQQQIHLEPHLKLRNIDKEHSIHWRLTFFSKSTECTEAAAPAPILTPSSGALYRPRPESSCNSPGPEESARVRPMDSTMVSSRRKCSMVLPCSWSLSFPFSIWETKQEII